MPSEAERLRQAIAAHTSSTQDLVKVLAAFRESILDFHREWRKVNQLVQKDSTTPESGHLCSTFCPEHG